MALFSPHSCFCRAGSWLCTLKSYSLLQGALEWPCGEIWGDTRLVLPSLSAHWRHVLIDQSLRGGAGQAVFLRDVLADVPLALLVAEPVV